MPRPAEDLATTIGVAIGYAETIAPLVAKYEALATATGGRPDPDELVAMREQLETWIRGLEQTHRQATASVTALSGATQRLEVSLVAMRAALDGADHATPGRAH